MPLAREQRKLAAIVAADVVGYSRLMGRDESGTLARLRKNRSEHLDPVLTKYGGRLVKLTGDGALVEFASAVDALSAAIEFQQAMAEANGDRPNDTALVFRMGLHLGDLIIEGDDLYGDGVNIAARLEGEAPAGGIVISGDVHDAVAGRLKAAFDDLGSLALKNIERAVQAFGVKWEPGDWKVSAPTAPAPTIAAPPAADIPLALPEKPSIAVLPFLNMSGDPGQEYFTDGITEDIITDLSRFRSLFVIARHSSFSYKGKSPDIREVGKELGVRYVLEGSIRKASNRIRVTAQLIDTLTGSHIWAERYDRVLEDIFALQEEVTKPSWPRLRRRSNWWSNQRLLDAVPRASAPTKLPLGRGPAHLRHSGKRIEHFSNGRSERQQKHWRSTLTACRRFKHSHILTGSSYYFRWQWTRRMPFDEVNGQPRARSNWILRMHLTMP